MIRKTLIVSALALVIQATWAGPTATLNGIMTDSAGNTLYTFDKDEPGRSNCAGDCLKKWQAFIAKPEARETGDFSLIGRADGGRQWAVKGKPMYYFAGDQTPGQRNGEGIGGVWHVIDASQAGAPRAADSGASNVGNDTYSY
jgi:predicted lipoprotein with Yx(FWY)xxD motif